jgi:FHS family L-fucose permease-like MFS transporter
MGSPSTGAHRLTWLVVSIRSEQLLVILLGIALFGMGDNKKTALSLEDINYLSIILGINLVVYFMNFSKIENPIKLKKR